MVELLSRFVDLLAKKMECGQNVLARFIGVELHVVTNAVRRKKTVERAGGEQLFANNLTKQLLSVIEQFFGFGFLQNRRVAPAQFPGVEEGRPIYEWDKFFQREVVEHTRAEEGGFGDVLLLPFNRRSAAACLGNRQ